MKESVNISNYEAFVTDYLDGNLIGSRLEEFKSFLLMHPEISAEIEELAATGLCVNPQLQELMEADLHIHVKPLGSIHTENYEEAFAECSDRNVSPDHLRMVRDFVSQNPLLERDFKLYQLAVLQPNDSIRFDGASSLKQPLPLRFAPSPLFLRVAASIALLIGVYFTIQKDEKRLQYTPRLTSTVTSDQKNKPMISVDPLKIASSNLPNQSTSPPRQQDQPTIDVVEPTPEPVAQNEIIDPIESATISMEQVPTVATIYSDVPVNAEEKVTGTTEVQTIPELLLQRVLGMKKGDKVSPSSLLAHGLAKFGPRGVEFRTDSAESNKNSVLFAAGNFEFRRVNYH